MTLNSQSVTQTTKAVFDTGTSLLAMPSAEVAAIAKIVGATPLINGEYTISCSSLPSLPTLVIILNGLPYPLTPTQYVINGARVSLRRGGGVQG